MKNPIEFLGALLNGINNLLDEIYREGYFYYILGALALLLLWFLFFQ